MSEGEGLVSGGRLFRLPEGARLLAQAVTPLPVPGAPPGLLGVVNWEGRVLPAWSLDPAPAHWALLPRGLLGGSARAAAPPDAPLLRLLEPPAPLAPPQAALPMAEELPPPLPAPPATVVLRLGGARLALPMAALAGIRPWPELLTPVPGRPEATLGYALVADGPVLLLAADWCFGQSGLPAPGHVAVLRQGGAQLGIPCQAVAPGTEAAPLLQRLNATAEGARLLGLAPRVAEAAARDPRPRRRLLLCQAGEARFFLPAAAVEAVLPPQRPRPLPGGAGSLCAHRGTLLPVRDAAWRLGAGRMGEAPPLLRLGGPERGFEPCALAVSRVMGLRPVPEAEIAPVAGDALVEALVRLKKGPPVPLCRAPALGAAP